MATSDQLRANLPRREGSPSRLQLAHALSFACGLFGTLAGAVTHNPYYFLVAGPCLSISGALILLGSRITFRGPVGATLRAVLGASRVRRLNLQAIVWLVAGILVSAWGVDRVRHRDAQPIIDEPAIGAR
ncbi:MAG TPA: hypothetical protein VJR89_34635 [Polyangiales bacterium]|nr:hypothetical protein [Polyangiales bacterium]